MAQRTEQKCCKRLSAFSSHISLPTSPKFGPTLHTSRLQTLGYHPNFQSVVLQDQQLEMIRYSTALSREQPQGSEISGDADASGGHTAVAADNTAGERQQQAGLSNTAGRSSLNRHSSHLTWSQRQQLRRTLAAQRHAAASRHVPPQESRRPSGH